MPSLGWQELLIILVIVVIIFGGAKLAGVGKASGRAIREFKEEIKGSDPEPAKGLANTTAQAEPPAGAGFQIDTPVTADTPAPANPDLR